MKAFGPVRSLDVRSLAGPVVDVQVSAGTQLVREGIEIGTFFVIRSGTAELTQGERNVGTLGSGDCFGEIDAMAPSPQPFGVTASSPMRLLTFSAFGISRLCEAIPGAQERLIEGLEGVLQAWRGQRFSHEGRFYRFCDLEVWPPGQQQPGPPVWISCSRSPASFEWAARHGHNLLTIGFISPVAKSAALTRVYREAWSGPGEYQIGTLYHAIVAESGAKARQLALPAIKRFLAQKEAAEDLAVAQEQRAGAGGATEDFSIERMIDEARLVAGSPQEVVDMLRYLQSEIGFTQVDLMFQLGGLPFEIARESMGLFAAEVMPKLRTLSL